MPIMSSTNIAVTLTHRYPGAALLDRAEVFCQYGIIVSRKSRSLFPSTLLFCDCVETVGSPLGQQAQTGALLVLKHLPSLLALRPYGYASRGLVLFLSLNETSPNDRCAEVAQWHWLGKNNQISPSLGLGLRIRCRPRCQDELDKILKDKWQLRVSDGVLNAANKKQRNKREWICRGNPWINTPEIWVKYLRCSAPNRCLMDYYSY